MTRAEFFAIHIPLQIAGGWTPAEAQRHVRAAWDEQKAKDVAARVVRTRGLLLVAAERFVVKGAA